MLFARKLHLRLYMVEKLTLIYMFLTSFIVLFLLINNHPVWNLLFLRIGISLIILGLAYVTSLRKKTKLIVFIRFLLIGGLLLYWYPETFDINRYFVNQDAFLAEWEQRIFHCQPALVFYKMYPSRIVSELMNLGYFSLFPMIVFSSAYFFFKDRTFFHRFFYLLMFSFLSFYFIFAIFPAAGPQYYFKIIGEENALKGIFPPIGTFFSNNYIEPFSEPAGFFNTLVTLVQTIGERPTAAFPSSHVGISSLVMFLIFGNKQYRLFAFLFPLYFFLVLATVYIQAHYAIDAIVGFISAFVFYFLGIKFFNIIHKF